MTIEIGERYYFRGRSAGVHGFDGPCTVLYRRDDHYGGEAYRILAWNGREVDAFPDELEPLPGGGVDTRCARVYDGLSQGEHPD